MPEHKFIVWEPTEDTNEYEKSDAFMNYVFDGIQNMTTEDIKTTPMSGELFVGEYKYFCDSWLNENRFSFYVYRFEDHCLIGTVVFDI